MHAHTPLSPVLPQSTDTPFPGYAPLDIEREPLDENPFPSALPWSADDLVEAVRIPLHRVVFTPSANDARLHRPRRTLRFLATPPLATRFRIGG